MKIVINTILCGFAVATLSSCATRISKDKDAPKGKPAATLTYKGGSAAYWVSAGGGTGKLNYNGGHYPFTATSVGAGGSGGKSSSAIGNVYHLKQLSDFPGQYTGVRSGYTLIRGKQHSKLTNSKGVIIYVEANTVGLATSTGAVTVLVTMN